MLHNRTKAENVHLGMLHPGRMAISIYKRKRFRQLNISLSVMATHNFSHNMHCIFEVLFSLGSNYIQQFENISIKNGYSANISTI